MNKGSEQAEERQQLHLPTLAAFVKHQRYNYRKSPTAAPVRLSRAALATDSGLSTGYIIKIEQGLALNPSDSALNKISVSLNLNDAEREHLFALARLDGASAAHEDETAEPATKITEAEHQYLGGLNPHLAAFVDPSWNVLAANDAYYAAFPGLADYGNVLTWFFHCQYAKHVMVEWEAEAQLTVSWFRSLMAAYPSDAHQEVFDICATSQDFVRMWNIEDVLADRQRPEKILRDLKTRQIYVIQVHLWRPPVYSDRYTFYLATAATATKTVTG